MWSRMFSDEVKKNMTPLREFNKLKDDPCAIQQENAENNKKLKFVTISFKDLLDAKESGNFFGINIRDQLFVPSSQMDMHSSLLNGSNGNAFTKAKVQQNALPLPTLPARYQMAHGNIDIEDSFKNLTDTNKKSSQSQDYNFHNRFFYMFPNIEQPDALKSTEEYQRGGKSSRF